MARDASGPEGPPSASRHLRERIDHQRELGRQARREGLPRHNRWQRRGPAERALYDAWDEGWREAGSGAKGLDLSALGSLGGEVLA